MKKLLLFTFFSAVSIALPALAVNSTCMPDKLTTALVQLKTGGFWKKEGQYGRYRVLVWTKGWEHVGNTVELQVLGVDQQAKKVNVLRCVVMQKPGSSGNVVGDIQIQSSQKGKTIVELMMHRRDPSSKLKTVTYQIQPNGSVKKR